MNDAAAVRIEIAQLRREVSNNVDNIELEVAPDVTLLDVSGSLPPETCSDSMRTLLSSRSKFLRKTRLAELVTKKRAVALFFNFYTSLRNSRTLWTRLVCIRNGYKWRLGVVGSDFGSANAIVQVAVAVAMCDCKRDVQRTYVVGLRTNHRGVLVLGLYSLHGCRPK